MLFGFSFQEARAGSIGEQRRLVQLQFFADAIFQVSSFPLLLQKQARIKWFRFAFKNVCCILFYYRLDLSDDRISSSAHLKCPSYVCERNIFSSIVVESM
ncbi:Os03g0821250 [Oryza sativa Japonica Group]|uniref:Os03g0821250 protein n=2 Tax=Oryza sativa subsp. japonica TaxID=39947 RepID=C7IZJ1_ORYSJ|nr:hypothetical protein EE612_021341 [Oryza sativa]KAF2942059.1 hypothetical protein DAI22_03g394200 [Oryza sativa Japonica Group]BAH92416.1 Os03g0821250 [Oryza sativa Japonica Group]BAS87093.1 Os03g0821250 [Oryza sativa Japonica Group]|eukprot:NP_001173688.1 Os03g0821250 [Oryza sativa Japonica Group]